MIHPDMATMLAFMATDAPIAAPLLDAARARGRRRVVQRRDRRRRHVDQRQLRASRRPARRRMRADHASATIRACVPSATRSRRSPSTLAQAIVRDGEGATKFIAIRVEGGRDADECRASRSRSRIRRWSRPRSSPPIPTSAASSARSATRPRPTSIPRASRSGSTTCWSSTRAAARASYREEDGQRVMKQDEITHPRRPRPRRARATVWTCDFSHDYVQINADYRSLPGTATSKALIARAEGVLARVEALLPAAAARSGLEESHGRALAQARRAAATCRRSRIPHAIALDDLVADRRAEAARSTATRASSSPGCPPTTCC